MYMVYGERVDGKPAKSGPKRIIFYRGPCRSMGCQGFHLTMYLPPDGVSEGQFKHVLERGTPCANISFNQNDN
jgi:hypothetical protein